MDIAALGVLGLPEHAVSLRQAGAGLNFPRAVRVLGAGYLQKELAGVTPSQVSPCALTFVTVVM